jgi:hypothetical protein
VKSQQKPLEIRSVEDLIRTVRAFMNKPRLWSKAIHTNGRYFIHVRENGADLFGLSKFCNFRGVSLVEWVGGVRRMVRSGYFAEKHIEEITKHTWTPLTHVNGNVRKAFLQWWNVVFPNGRSDKRIKIISLGESIKDVAIRKRSAVVSPHQLARRLDAQEKLGATGEKIAVAYEVSRLQKLGVRDPQRFVEHTAATNVAAGFDIWSHAPRADERFIEVKSTSNGVSRFFISQAQVDVLGTCSGSAFLYLVKVADVRKSIGHVDREIQNPIRVLREADLLRPVLYEVDAHEIPGT